MPSFLLGKVTWQDIVVPHVFLEKGLRGSFLAED